MSPAPITRRHGLLALAAALCTWAGCNRSGAYQTVVDWDIYLDVRSAEAIDRWMAGARIETHDVLRSTIHRSIPAVQWLKAEPRYDDGPVPGTTVAGAVTPAPAPLPTTTDLPVEYFSYPMTLVVRDPVTGNELVRRSLTPGYNAFKCFLDAATGTGEVGILYRGNLLVVSPITWSRGRHQSFTLSVTADQTTPRSAPLPPLVR